MLTYQDLKKQTTDQQRMDFVRKCISEHQTSQEYQTAVIADDYYRRRNTTIVNYQKLLYTMTGQAIPDTFSPNYKLCSGFFKRFVVQKVQYLLGNGVSWKEDTTADKLGTKKKPFDTQLQKLAKYAKRGGKAYGFWNLDHMDVFKFTEFKELPDENTSAIRAGVRFWQIDSNKPLRATLYEEDGYTEYIWNKLSEDGTTREEWQILEPKKPYILNTQETTADGLEIVSGENYPTFPIVPLWANEFADSEIVGLRENIDCFDLIKSGYANTVDEASMLYWTIQNAGGMDDVDLGKFRERMRIVKAAALDDGAKAEAHTIDLPYQSREALLTRLRNDMFDDSMTFDAAQVIGGASTATQIMASYESPDDDADDFEYFVVEFVSHILDLAGIEDNPSFVRSKIVNTQEEISTLLSAGEYLPSDYITEKIVTILGDIDKVDEILEDMDAENLERLTEGGEGEWTTDTQNPTEGLEGLSAE